MTAAHARMLFTITNTLSERENRGRADLSGPSGWESKRSSEGIRVKRRFSSSPETNHRHRQSRESVSESSRSISGKFGFAAPDELTPIRLLRSRKVYVVSRNETSLRKAKKGTSQISHSQNGERKRTIQSRKSERKYSYKSRGPASGRRARVVIFVNIAYAYVRKAISCTSVTRTGTV